MVVRKLAAGALLLLLVIWGGASGSGPARADGEVRGCDPKVGTGSADWCDDADRLPDIATIDKLARSVGGDRFGGIYIDRDVTPSVYVVSLVNPTEEDRAEFRKLSPDLSEIRVRGVQFPLSKLTQTADDIGAEDESQKILYSGGPSVIENKVVVRVDGSLKGNITAIVDKLGLDERMIEYGSPEKFAAGASRTTFPPFAGGLRLEVYPLSGADGTLCTSGFTIFSNGGTYMGLTAGHCATGHLADGVWIGSSYVDRSGRNSFVGTSSASSDAMRFSLTPASSRSSKIFVNGSSTSYRSLKSPRYTMSTLVEGTRLCFQGVTSDNDNCGNVTSADITQSYTVPSRGVFTLHHAFIFAHSCYAGDSGGSVYHVNSNGTAKAAAIVSACTSSQTLVTQLGHALADMDATLYCS